MWVGFVGCSTAVANRQGTTWEMLVCRSQHWANPMHGLNLRQALDNQTLDRPCNKFNNTGQLTPCTRPQQSMPPRCKLHPPPADTNLLRRVGVVRDEAELARAGRVDLLVLGSRPHAGDAGELQLVAPDGRHRQEAVQQGDRQVQRVAAQAILKRHLHQPVHQDGAHVGAHVLLDGLHIAGVGAALPLWVRGGFGVG